MPGVTHDDAPRLADLMPWSVAPPRLGRAWPAAPDAATLKARWDALLKAEGPDRAALFEPTRSRTPHTAVGRLPGGTGGTGRLARASGPCPEPVRVLRAPFDEQWLIPDHRLIDAARPELWRVADDRQVFVLEAPDATGPPLLLATSLLPLYGPARVRPLFRRPGGAEPNLAPGLLDHLAVRLGRRPGAVDVLAWSAAAVRPGPVVPLTADPEVWERGVELGRRAQWLMRRDGERPKLPGGRRPYVRAPLPARPLTVRYDRDEEVLHLDEGRVSPVPPGAWDFEVGGVRVLEEWFTARTAEGEPGTLAAIRPAGWPQSWTSELLELITVLALLGEVRADCARFTGTPVPAEITAAELREAGILPVPSAARRPASVLDTPEEGPEGQLALL
ncbi:MULTISPECIES: type ISP restriction/modification enzyme [Streptomyces]|uniref:type ISP restriction/modification enzyme n=1 Tax=Streptomyces TaxID=1883 RepID=UPI001CCD5B57|nr:MULTISPECIES: type ISP restriction/modification enzyme [Streptomyces]MBZ6138486.1 DNA methyltransferase [Streptomyces olivaceus]MBZ6166731.1 DNA methyltransferase [Streptomyces olivaceus]MCM8553569.1 DNA methyltransferase [Streptomyces sp. STCH 565 A]